MDRGNRSELIKTVEAQQEKIQKYETKLRDLITAYKSVVKEKEALEASVKALTVTRPTAPSTPRPAQPQGTDEGDDASNNDETASETQEEGSLRGGDAQEEEIAQLQDRLATLTTSLMTVTQEKSKLEANFVADKKKLRIEMEEKNEELATEKKQSEEMIQQLTQDLQVWKNKLRSQQHEREKEHHDHAMMLRELQKLLGDERESKEMLEHQIDDLKQELQETKASTANNDQHEKMIQDLLQEHDTLREMVRQEKEKALQPSAELEQVKQQLEELEAQHHLSLQREQMHTSDIEAMMNRKAMDSEQRASSLEAKVSELSEVVGNYERLRFQDQQAIQKLKEKISLLGMENMALTQASQRRPTPDQEFSYLEGGTDIQEILDKIMKLKQLLKEANLRSEKPEDLDALLQSLMGEIDPDRFHAKCQEDFDQLKEEFERYKLRAQSVLKSKSSKDPSPSIEVDSLKTQITELKDRLYQLRADYEEQAAVLKTKEEAFRNSVNNLTEKHAEEFSQQGTDFKKRLAEQEIEIRRHRERTIALLAEKDRELDILRQRTPEHLESQYVSTYRQMSQGSDPEEVGASSEGGGTAVNELLARTSVHPGSPGETTLLHFAQEQARKEVDIQNLRKQKHGLEMGMRELQQSSILKEQRYLEQIDVLKEEIRKYERNISRESANLEYLKNVVYHFMVSQDKMGKMGTLNAIALILQFSPREKDKVKKELDRGWWNYVNAQKTGPHTQL